MIDIDKILSPISGMPNFSGSNERSTPTTDRTYGIFIRLNEVRPALKAVIDSITAEFPELDPSPARQPEILPKPETTTEVTIHTSQLDTSTTEHRVVMTVEEQRIQAARMEVIDALNNPMRPI